MAEHRWGDAECLPLVPDASFRQYLRLRQNHRTAMLMDAPPPRENVGAFVQVTRHLEKIGVRVPAIYAVDIDNGFLLLEDLGELTFSRLLARGHDETALYRQAVGVLSHLHQHADAAAIDLPVYNVELAVAEANLLVDWYIPARREQAVSAHARGEFHRVWEEIFAALPPLTPTLVLRDYHVDNLLLNGDECALLDYQDAVIGSPGYDLVSLLEDARRDLAPAPASAMMRWYLEQNRQTDRHHLHQHCVVWGAQRHCKVAGIFVRLWLRDGKDIYLQHLPRVMKLLQRHLHEPALQPLRHWLDNHLGALDHAHFSAPPAQLFRHCNTR